MDGKSRPEFEAQMLAWLEKIGIDTQKYPVQFEHEGDMHDPWKPITVYPDGHLGFEMHAWQELIKIPAFEEQWSLWEKAMWPTKPKTEPSELP
jgi:hypothetical protein